MRIGIDARLIGQTGVGRYIRNLLRELQRIDTVNEYLVFTRSEDSALVSLSKRWRMVPLDVHWHTFSEQFVLPWVFLREKLDLVHIPYFTIPLIYPGKMIVTIHDLTVLHVNTGKASTLPYPLYQMRRLGYEFILKYGLIRAQKILAVSHVTKQDIESSCNIPADKIVVTYEGIDPQFLVRQRDKSKNREEKPYFLYVGNAYPHKNLETVLQAFLLLKQARKDLPYTLKCVGVSDYFYRRMQQSDLVRSLNGVVEFTGSVTDNQLLSFYDQSLALLFPSVMEGFGLPALEAYSRGCPVLCSDIAVFHELFGSAVHYIEPKNVEQWAKKITAVWDKPFRTDRDQSLLSRFDWHKMAEATLHAYEGCTGIRSDK